MHHDRNGDQMTTSLEVTSELRSTGWLLSARGEIDVTSSTALQAALDVVIDGGAAVVILDVEGVEFLDSSGLRVIVRAGRALSDDGGQLFLRGASGAVARTLEVTGLLERFAEPSRR